MRGRPQADHRRAGPFDDEPSDEVVESGEIDGVVEDRSMRSGDELMEEIGDVVVVDDVARHDARTPREEAAKSHEDGAAAGQTGEAEDLATGPQTQPFVHPGIGAFVAEADQIGGGAVVVGRVAGVERRAQSEQKFGRLGRSSGEELGERVAGEGREQGRDRVGLGGGGRRIAIRPPAHVFGPRLRDCQGQPLTQ